MFGSFAPVRKSWEEEEKAPRHDEDESAENEGAWAYDDITGCAVEH